VPRIAARAGAYVEGTEGIKDSENKLKVYGVRWAAMNKWEESQAEGDRETELPCTNAPPRELIGHYTDWWSPHGILQTHAETEGMRFVAPPQVRSDLTLFSVSAAARLAVSWEDLGCSL
jgi:hypothetical protein